MHEWVFCTSVNTPVHRTILDVFPCLKMQQAPQIKLKKKRDCSEIVRQTVVYPATQSTAVYTWGHCEVSNGPRIQDICFKLTLWKKEVSTGRKRHKTETFLNDQTIMGQMTSLKENYKDFNSPCPKQYFCVAYSEAWIQGSISTSDGVYVSRYRRITQKNPSGRTEQF